MSVQKVLVFIVLLSILCGSDRFLCVTQARADEVKSQERAGIANGATPGRYVVIHSDDAGMSHSVNLATIEGMEKGIVSSCSIMVPCPWFPEFAEYAKSHPEKDYGIHLTLNSEFDRYRWGPVAPRDQVPSLVDENGYLWGSKEEVQKHARPREVEIELRAQIDRALKAGIRLSHLDTHMGTVVSTGEMLEIYIRLGVEYKLPVMIMRRIQPELGEGYPDLVAKHTQYCQLMEQNQLPVIDELFQFYSGKTHEERKELYLKTIREIPPGNVAQVIIHCGYDDRELQGITSSHFIRGNDTRIFTDAEVAAEIKKMGVEVLSWTQLTEMQRARGNERR